MPGRNNYWGQLVVSVLLLLLGVKALARGQVRHWLIPEYGASGGAAKFVGVLCLILGAVTLIDLLRKNRIDDRK